MELTRYEQSMFNVYKNRSLLHFAEMFQGIYDLNDYSYTDNDLKRVYFANGRCGSPKEILEILEP